ncbi:MAG: fumarylacetoacetate hydrolase family protein [Phascolarctobacterium sp.]|nr:fumarylacetoacetate hydrolase family protein [Phascolarctobacterium sp.]
MRLYTAYINKKEEILVAFYDDGCAYVMSKLAKLSSELNFSDMNDLIDKLDAEKITILKAVAKNVDSLSGAEVKLSEVKLCAPIVHPRQDVICLGINYRDHQKEATRFSAESFDVKKDDAIYFSKRVNRATAPGEAIPAYEGYVDSLDYESELGVIIGKETKNATVENALANVFGYTVINDVSARNIQRRHQQWYLGKSLDGFTPIGPCIVTADGIEDVQNLDVKSYVNGELRQSSNTRYMITTVAEAIADLSQGMTLLPGTIIATGTPAGVGMGMQPPVWMKKGDVVVCEIEGIGRLENSVE